MNKPTLYMETTIPSYLLAEPSRDVISLGRQDITRTWWKRDHTRYAISISEVVIQEADRGDCKDAEKIREFQRPFPLLDATPEVRALTKLYLEKGIIPPGNAEAAAHLAFASIHKIEFLCTWNFKHLANAFALRRFREVNEKKGFFVPQVCTPEQLPGEGYRQTDPILREVYRMKDELNREIGGDLKKLFARFDKFAKEHPERMVNLEQVRKISGRKTTGRKRATTKS